jgi:heme-degrading monooxygenase HmoA
MTVVKINALQIPPQAGDEIVKRFTARMDSLTDVAGFEGFELLRPTGDAETRWFVYTRWADQDSYERRPATPVPQVKVRRARLP